MGRLTRLVNEVELQRFEEIALGHGQLFDAGQEIASPEVDLFSSSALVFYLETEFGRGRGALVYLDDRGRQMPHHPIDEIRGTAAGNHVFLIVFKVDML